MLCQASTLPSELHPSIILALGTHSPEATILSSFCQKDFSTLPLTMLYPKCCDSFYHLHQQFEPRKWGMGWDCVEISNHPNGWWGSLKPEQYSRRRRESRHSWTNKTLFLMSNIATASLEYFGKENKSKSCKSLDSFQNWLWVVKILPGVLKPNLCLISSIQCATNLSKKPYEMKLLKMNIKMMFL